MGRRAAHLWRLLEGAGLRPASGRRRPSLTDLERAGLADPAEEVYRALGGVKATPRVMPGAWDLTFNDVVVELDEERHFNRYRATTLESAVYSRLSFPVQHYRELCARHEVECLKAAGWRGNWTTNAAEAEFGVSAPERRLDGSGSARWKQRAFYDFVKDLAPLCFDVAVARVSIWDTIDYRGLLVEKALTTERADVAEVARSLLCLVYDRAGVS